MAVKKIIYVVALEYGDTFSAFEWRYSESDRDKFVNGEKQYCTLLACFEMQVTKNEDIDDQVDNKICDNYKNLNWVKPQ